MDEKELSVALSAQKVLSQVRSVVVGKDGVLQWVLAAILARGHILLEDIPGVGKTTMALAFSRSLGLHHNRMQFTPDVLPSDVTGYNIPGADGTMVYRAGSVLCNLFLADELNRATSRTQAALLEAMEEGQVTVDGVTHKLPEPFTVIATQNPSGAAGTQLLPDSQLDRFLVRLSLGYPSAADEIAMVRNRQGWDPMKAVEKVMTGEELLQVRQIVDSTFVSQEIIAYAVALTGATRTSELIARGASPRASLALVSISKAVAQLRGRDYVVPKDIQEAFLPVVAHRILLSAKAQGQALTPEGVLKNLLRTVAVPRIR